MSVYTIPPVPADIVAPAPVAEPGQTTTEFIGKTAIQVLTVLIALLTTVGHGLSVSQQTAILGLAGTIVAALEGVYSVSRGVRKAGTNG